MNEVLEAVVGTLDIDPPSQQAFETFIDAQLSDGLVEAEIKRLVVDRLLARDEADRTSQELASHGLSPSTREGLALDYVDHFSSRYNAIPDAIWQRLHSEFADAELVELSWTIAVVKGMLRVSAALGAAESP